MRKKTLLLINGSQVLMDLTKKIFERAGYSVRCAVGIAGAQEVLMDYIPDGIVLDNDLPDGKGLDYCRTLVRETAIPIMFLSNAKEDELPALQAGASDFLKKPFDYEIMKTRIGVILRTNPVSRTSGDAGEEERGTEIFLETEETENLQSMQTETAHQSVKKKKIFNPRSLYLTAAACFTFLFGGIWIFNAVNSSPEIFIPEEQTPLGGLPFQTEENTEPCTNEDEVISFPVIGNVTVPAGSTNVQMLLLNPEKNRCYFTFEIVLADTGESLYLSEPVEPGKCIEDITLSKGLAEGEYNADLKIRAYEIENHEILNSTNIEFYLTAN